MAVNRNRPSADRSQALGDLIGRFRAWYGLKQQSKELTSRLEKDKADFKALVERWGETDDKDNVFLELPERIGEVVALKNECRVSTSADEEQCQRILRRKGLWDQCVETIEVLDPDKVHALYFERKITKAELDRMFPRRVSYAFTLIGEGGKKIS